MKLTVKAQREYEVITTENFDSLNVEVKKVFSGNKILILSDKNVAPLYLNEVKNCLQGFIVYTYVVNAGEKSKSIKNYAKILEFLAKNKFSRGDCVFALGGGVVGDLAGFVSATYMRGIKLIQCPTTFLSAIDSSIGGKTAIDLKEGKNLAGAFYQPSLTYINVSTLKSLPNREVLCGMGEAVKYAFISKTVTPDMLKKGITEELIIECLKIKADIVKEDEFDSGRRAVLNLGHTVGHAVETLSKFKLSHGEAVAKGIKKAIEISAKYYGYGDDKVEEFLNLLNVIGCNLDVKYTADEILEKIANDKKSDLYAVNFVLIKDIGDVETVKIPFDKLGSLIV